MNSCPISRPTPENPVRPNRSRGPSATGKDLFGLAMQQSLAAAAAGAGRPDMIASERPKADEPKARELKAHELKAHELKTHAVKANEPKTDVRKGEGPAALEAVADGPFSDGPVSDGPVSDGRMADGRMADSRMAGGSAAAAGDASPAAATDGIAGGTADRLHHLPGLAGMPPDGSAAGEDLLAAAQASQQAGAANPAQQGRSLPPQAAAAAWVATVSGTTGDSMNPGTATGAAVAARAGQPAAPSARTLQGEVLPDPAGALGQGDPAAATGSHPVNAAPAGAPDISATGPAVPDAVAGEGTTGPGGAGRAIGRSGAAGPARSGRTAAGGPSDEGAALAAGPARGQPFAVAPDATADAAPPSAPERLAALDVQQLVSAWDLKPGVHGQMLTVRLNPDVFGPMSIRIEQTADGLAARIQTESREACALLEAQRGLLEEALQAKGFNCPRIDIAWRARGDGQPALPVRSADGEHPAASLADGQGQSAGQRPSTGQGASAGQGHQAAQEPASPLAVARARPDPAQSRSDRDPLARRQANGRLDWWA